MLRDVLDGKKTLDQVPQERKQRKVDDLSQLKTLLGQLNDLRASGLISEDAYQEAASKQPKQLSASPRTESQGSVERLYAPRPG